MRQASLRDIGDRLTHIRADSSQKTHASTLEVPLRTYQNYERGDREPDLRTLLALVEQGWNANWLLTGEGPERLSQLQVAEGDGSQELSGEHLSVAVELADEALRGLWLPRRRYWDLVALIYDALTQGLPYAEVIAFARPAATEMAGAKTNDGRSEVDGEGAGDPGRGKAHGNG